MRGYWCKDCNSFFDRKKIKIRHPFFSLQNLSIAAWENIMICSICGGKIIRKKIPQYQIEAMDMIQTMNLEDIKDGMPPEDGKFDQYLEKAHLLFDAMEYEDSINYWKMILTLKPKDIFFWIMIGKSYERIGEWNDAVESYSKALKINPSDKDARMHKERLEKRIAKIYNL